MGTQVFREGDVVVFTSMKSHEAYPGWYPVPGTLGTIKFVSSMDCLVEFEKGSTSGDDTWFVNYEDLDLYEDYHGESFALPTKDQFDALF